MGLSLGTLACRPIWAPGEAEPWDCDPRPMLPGEARVKRAACGDELLPGGDGDRGDWILENAYLRAVVKDQGESLSRPGRAGGTIIDLVTTGGDNDGLFELLPELDGDWLVDATVTPVDDADAVGVDIEGTTITGRDAKVELRLGRTAARLELRGAEGLAAMPLAGGVAAGEVLEVGGGLFATDGPLVEDRGGELRWEGVEALTVNPLSALGVLLPRRWSGLVQGVAQGEIVEAWAGGALVVRTVLPNGAGAESEFAFPVPPEVDGLRVLSLGRAPGALVAPEPGQRLPEGEGSGLIDVIARDDAGDPVPVAVWWGEARYSLSTGAGQLPLGPGTARLRVSAGPAHGVVDLGEVELQGVLPVSARLPRVIADPPVLAELGLTAWPDPQERRSASTRIAQATARGARFVVTIADDRVPDAVVSVVNRPTTHALAASRANTPAGRPFAFPWSQSGGRPGLGAIDWDGLSAVDLAAAMNPIDSRVLVVDAGWVEAAGPPTGWSPAPTGFFIDDLSGLGAYTALLDQWTHLSLLGPQAWLDGTRAATATPTDALAAFHEGRTVATTGPLLTLRVGGAGPGSDLSDTAGPHTAALQVEAPTWIPLDHAALIGPDGELARWSLRADAPLRLDAAVELPEGLPWVLAVAWADDPSPPLVPRPAWAATTAVFLRRP